MTGRVSSHEFPDQGVLGVVGVLVLVHQHVAEPPPVVLEDLGERAEHVHGLADQVVEVHGVGRAQPLGVSPVHLRDRRLEGVRGAGPRQVRLVVHELVLQRGEVVLDGLRR